MPAAPRIVSLNLGSQTIGLAVFQPQPNGGLVLTDYRLREILADPSAETDRDRQISEALGVMMRKLGLKGGPIEETETVSQLEPPVLPKVPYYKK